MLLILVPASPPAKEGLSVFQGFGLYIHDLMVLVVMYHFWGREGVGVHQEQLVGGELFLILAQLGSK